VLGLIDVAKIKYRLVIMSETGAQYNVKDYVENLGWEENKSELATRISFTTRDENSTAGFLSAIAKLGCLVGVFASVGEETDEEVARGYIVTWKPTISGDKDKLDCKCYDELFNLQQSQDNIYYSAGAGTKTVLEQIFADWQIPIDRYEGPNVTHAKLVYKSESLSDVILDVLDDAVKKGGEKCMVRATKGSVNVLPYGINKVVYCFGVDNTKIVSHNISSADMVTRVKVIGQADDEGKSSVEATLDGNIQYGVRQKIYTRGNDDSLEDARSAAQSILDESGTIKEEITVQGLDVPTIRKGDLVNVKVGTLNGYYYVMGIQHDADSFEMTMELEKAESQ